MNKPETTPPTYFHHLRDGTLSRPQSDKLTVPLSLHLLQNCMVYISTVMVQQILARPEWKGRLTPRDLHALTPLFWGHVNPYGRFDLNMRTRIATLA